MDDPKEPLMASVQPKRRRKRRRRKRRLGISPPFAFYPVAVFALLSAALVYLRGEPYIGLSIGSAVLIFILLIVSERSAFSASRRIRRPYDTRKKFNMTEVTVFFVLLMLNVFVSVTAWVA